MKRILKVLFFIIVALSAFAFSACDLTNPDKGDSANAPCRHSYGEWVAVEEGNCLMTAKLVRTCSLCGDEDITYALGDHVYGELVAEVSSTLFAEGTVAHYTCEICGKNFNSDKQPIDTLMLPKLSPELSICLDGVAAASFTVDSSTDSLINLSLSGLEVTAGQTVSICQTDHLDIVYEYTVVEKQLSSVGIVWGNIDPTTHKIRTNSVSNLTVAIGKGGAVELVMDGYVHSGVVVEITSSRSSGEPVLFPMSKVDYYGDPEMQAYVFGLFGSDGSTSLRVIDMDTDTVYDYDDLSDANAWDKWSYSRGADGKIAFTEGILSDWWLAFDIGGDGKISMMRFNLSGGIRPTMTVIDGEATDMEKITLEVGSEEYNYYTWPLTEETFSRRDEWLDRIDMEKISIYREILQVDDSASFYIGSDYSVKPWTLLSTVYTKDGEIDKYTGTVKEGYVTKSVYGLTIKNAGTYVIEYLPFCNVINIYDYVEETPDPNPDYKGIAIEINGEIFAMNFVTYPSDESTSYVYGYVALSVGDVIRIVDTENERAYGFDDLSADMAWNTWDYHKGEDGEIVFDFAARYAFEFDLNGEKQIDIAKVFAPNHGEAFSIDFEGEREDVALQSFNLSESADLSGEFMWTLTHATTMNSSDFIEYVDKNGLWFHYTIIDMEEGETFSLKNLTTGSAIGIEYLTEVTGDITAVTKDGALVEVLKSGSFYIIYLPAFNSFTIDCDTTDPLSKIYIFGDAEEITLIPDENGDVFYNGLRVTTSSCFSITDAKTSNLPIILDEAMDKTLVDLFVYGDYYYVYTNKAGTCNLTYNVYTGILYLEYVGEEEGGGDDIGGGDTPSIDDYYYFLSVVDYTNGNQTLDLAANPDNAKEVCVSVTLAANSYISVGEMEKGGDYNVTSYGALADTDAALAQSYGELILVKQGGTINVYFNVESKTVRIEMQS